VPAAFQYLGLFHNLRKNVVVCHWNKIGFVTHSFTFLHYIIVLELKQEIALGFYIRIMQSFRKAQGTQQLVLI